MNLPSKRPGGPGKAACLLASLLAGLWAIMMSMGLLAAEVHAAEVAQGDVGKAGYASLLPGLPPAGPVRV